MNMKAILSKFFAWFFAGIVAFFLPMMQAMIMVFFLTLGTGILKLLKEKYSENKEKNGLVDIKTIPKLGVYFCILIAFRSAETIWPNYPLVKIYLGLVVAFEVWVADKHFKDLTGYSFISRAQETIGKFKKPKE